MKKSMFALIAVSMITVTTPVTAQDYVVAPIGPGTINGNIDWVGGLILQDQLHGNRPQTNSSTRPPAPRPSMPASVNRGHSSHSALSYVTSLERRQANYREMARNWRSNGSNIGQDGQAMLQSGDVLGRLEPTFNETLGLQMDNIADAYGYWLGVSWLAVNQSTQPLTRAQFEGLRQQIGAELTGNRIMGLANDAAKQTISETALINGLFTAHAASRSVSDPVQLQALAEQTNSAMKKAMNVDLTTVKLTDKGFEPR
jgi:hypothetical protein